MPDLDLLSLGGNFASLVTGGGIPINDISLNFNPAGKPETDRSRSIVVDGGAFASRQADAPRHVIYGKAKVPGTVTFFTTDQAGGGGFLHLVVTLATHRIHSVEELWLDGKLVTFGGGGIHADPRWGSGDWTEAVFMSVALGADDQLANDDLLAQSAAFFPGLWTVDHRQQGCAYAYIILARKPGVFPNSLPKIQFVVKGKPVFDPRDGAQSIDDESTWVWSDNAALCMNDYLCNERFGFDIDYATRMNEAALIDAADTCDEEVSLAAGGTEKRYTCNGWFTTDVEPQEILNKMLATFGGGSLNRIGRQFFPMPRKWRAPTFTITEDDIVSPLRVRWRQSRRDTWNGVRGTFVDPTQDWQSVDFPAVRNATYLSQDRGRENFLDVDFSFCTSRATAQRMGKLLLEEARQGITVDFNAKLRVFECTVGDVVNLTYARKGWNAKPFRITSMVPVRQGGGNKASLAFALTLRETAEGVHDWNNGEETTVDLAPDSYLPDPSVVTVPSSLTLSSGTAHLIEQRDGTLLPRIFFTWIVNDEFAADSGRTEVQFKKTADSEWIAAPYVTNETTTGYIAGVEDGVEYDVRVRSVNGAGYASAWVQVSAHEVLGKSELPSDVSNFNAAVVGYSIILTWSEIPDIDRKGYEIRYGGADWNSSLFRERVTGTTFTLPLKVAGSYQFFIKAFDRSDNYSFFPAGATAVITGPAQPTASIELVAGDVKFAWSEVVSQFAVTGYRISYGDVFATSTELVSTKATNYRTRVSWGGNRTFWIVAIDAAGNLSSPARVDVNVAVPGPVASLASNFFDNFVELRWTAPVTGLLPIEKYLVKVGATYAGATQRAEHRGTFISLFESTAGANTYWVVPVDTAGNEGTPTFVQVTVTAPRDYILFDDQILTDFDTYSFVVKDGAQFVGPVFTADTFESHFLNQGRTTIQQQIDAGYPFYMQPGAVDGYCEKVIDYGAIIGSAQIAVFGDFENLAGGTAFRTEVGYSEDGISYTSVVGSNILGLNFQYVKVKYVFDGVNAESFAVLRNPRVKLQVKTGSEVAEHTIVANAAGTDIPLSVSFLSITGVKITPRGNDRREFGYDVPSGPNPTYVTVYYRDETGTEAGGTFTLEVNGVLA